MHPLVRRNLPLTGGLHLTNDPRKLTYGFFRQRPTVGFELRHLVPS
jgi:hypothetical protein